MTKDEILIAFSIMILLFTAMVNWNIYSWLILIAATTVLLAWYIRGKSRYSRRDSIAN
jgi:Flp pilus assembly protein TadB